MNLILALVAGFLTTLSPCVLPVLPFVTNSSLNKNKLGPIFLGLGLLLSFVGVSLMVSSTGYLLGLDAQLMRKIAGLLLALSGVLFLLPRLGDWVAERLSFLSNFGGGGNASSRSLVSELAAGMLLGVVWTPCSGPSLGAALGLAAESGSQAQAALILSAFGVGALIPLLLVAYGARSTFLRLKQNAPAITAVKRGFGFLMGLFGGLIVLGFDKAFETWLTSAMPQAWVNFVTRF